MEPLPVVEHLDVVGDGEPGAGPVREGLAVENGAGLDVARG